MSDKLSAQASNPGPRPEVRPETAGLGVLGSATVRAPGSCGELVQGINGQGYFLVSCPVDFYSQVKVELRQPETQGIGGGEIGIEISPGLGKTARAVKAALAHLKQTSLNARVEVRNPIPRSKGLGSSSADVTAAIAATALALGRELDPEEIARLAVTVEPTDGVMFPGIAIFDHRDGNTMEVLGGAPPMEIVALDFGGTVDTLEFNRTDRKRLWESISGETGEALDLVRRGVEQGDPGLVGQGATISAQACQKVLAKPQLSQVMEFAASVGAVGVNVAHSGTIIGVLLDARQRRGLSVFRQAKQTFPWLEAIHHFRLLGGGLRRVDPKGPSPAA